MNIIITTKCNKRCSFCFARQKNKKINEISIDTFAKLMDFFAKSKIYSHFNLLGGEPTQHSKFIQIINEIVKRNLKFILISNALFDKPEILNTLLDAIKNKNLISALFNSSELDINNRLEIFKNNFMAFKEASKYDKTFDLTCGITLNRNKSLKDEIDYAEWIVNEIKPKCMRFSIDFIGNNQNDFHFINNKIYGLKILELSKLCEKNNIILNEDCIIYPCQFESKEVFTDFVKNKINKVNSFCIEKGAFDIFPNLDYCYCYPANKITGKNLFEFNTPEEAQAELAFRQRIINFNKIIPDICKSCQYFINEECDSLCVGCLNIDNSLFLSNNE